MTNSSTPVSITYKSGPALDELNEVPYSAKTLAGLIEWERQVAEDSCTNPYWGSMCISLVMSDGSTVKITENI
jgi:hypothetical protein